MLLSVVVPAHQVQGYLRAALESVTGQGPAGEAEPELIAVCTPDSPLELAVARETAERDPRVRVLVLDGPWDTGAARNAGAAAARGAYLLFLDGDDVLLPGAVAEISARLSDGPCGARPPQDPADARPPQDPA
ncbi:glycosyl transferase, partial [Streptomyces sp. FT05W]